MLWNGVITESSEENTALIALDEDLGRHGLGDVEPLLLFDPFKATFG